MNDAVARLLSVAEVAEVLHLHPKTVNLLINRGQLGAVAVGREGSRKPRRLVRPDQLQAYIDANTLEPDSPPVSRCDLSPAARPARARKAAS